MTDDGLNGILPAMKYRVPARHEGTHGASAVFVLPTQFAAYMRQAGITPSSALLDARLKEIGKVTRLVVNGVPTIPVKLTAGPSQ